MSKRKRDPTFTTSEKEALLELVEKHFSTVESKKTDAVSMKHKIEEWRKIATEFNAISGIHPREGTILRNCWENLKKRAKQEQTLRNQHYLGTGGGPPKKGIEDPVTKKVLELIQARVSGYVNSFDSDGINVLASVQIENSTPKTESQPLITESEIVQTTSTDTTTYNVDWSQYTPSMLRTKKNYILSPSPSTSQEQMSPLPEPSNTQQSQTPSTPPRALTSRRRPVYRRGTEGNLESDKIKTLQKASAQAEEEHEIKIKILHLQEEKEKEILKQELLKSKQEEIKLEILQLQLKALKD